MPPNGHWTDFVTDFMNYSAEAPIPPSPDLFRKWAGISTVASALGRRVWIQSRMGVTFPNLYVMLIGNPGVGKYIIEEARNLLRETVKPGTEDCPFFVAPDSMTHASIVDYMNDSKVTFLPPKGPPLVYHSLIVNSEEFQVLLPVYSPEFVSRLNDFYVNKAIHRETRRSGKVANIEFEKPQANLLGGATPTYLAHTFPDEAWGTGLARRTILIYSGETIFKELFEEVEWDEETRKGLLTRLGQMSQMYGQFQFTNSAVERIAQWHRDGGPPQPTHPRLESYNRSRTNLHAFKLCMVSAISRTGNLIVEEIDVKRAISWLLEAETFMPDIFRAMRGKSDIEVMEELWLMVATEWKNTHKPIRATLIADFLNARTQAHQMKQIWHNAELAGYVQKLAGSDDLWIPGIRKDFTREDQ